MAENSFVIVLFTITVILNIFYLLFLTRETGSIIVRAYTELYAQINREKITDDRQRSNPCGFIGITLASLLGLQGSIRVIDFKENIVIFGNYISVYIGIVTLMYVLFFLIKNKK